MYGATAGAVGILRFEATTNQAVCGITPNEQISHDFLYLILKANKSALIRLAGGGAQPNISQKIIREFQIPLPPLSVQEELVLEIEGYQKIIDGARAVLDHYRPHIPINPNWPVVELGEVCDKFQYGSSKRSLGEGEVVCLRMGNIQNGEVDWSNLKFAPEDEDVDRYLLHSGDVLFNRTNSQVHVGKTGIYRGGRRAVFAGYLIRIQYQKDKLLGAYLNYCLNTKDAKAFCQRVKTDGINQSNINARILRTFSIPLPPLAEQEAIVAEIEAEQALVEGNRELITRFEKKIQQTIARVWGDEGTGEEACSRTDKSASSGCLMFT